MLALPAGLVKGTSKLPVSLAGCVLKAGSEKGKDGEICFRFALGRDGRSSSAVRRGLHACKTGKDGLLFCA